MDIRYTCGYTGLYLAIKVYQYDANGNLIYDEGENMKIQWHASGKVQSVDKSGSNLSFAYSPLGQRQVKYTTTPQETRAQYYIHDAAGNVMCIYETQKDRLFLKEQPIYGSSRLGVMRNEIEIRQELRETLAEPAAKFTRILGQRRYELPDHLGNVHVSLSDRKQENKVINDIMTYLPQTASFTDYYPFGFPMPKRNESLQQYRYGFNGQEIDNEVYGEGASYSFEFRNYDSRLGRFWSVDPITSQFPELTSYQFASNSPIQNIEFEGLEGIHSMSQYEKLQATGQIAKEVYNALPPKVQKTVIGVANVASATIGIITSTIYMMGTNGVGAILGGSTAFQLSVTQAGIGISQIAAAFSNKSIPQGNTVPGMIAYYSGSEYAALIDVGTSLFSSSLIPNVVVSNTLLNTISAIDRSLSGLNFTKEIFQIGVHNLPSDNKDFQINVDINQFKDTEKNLIKTTTYKYLDESGNTQEYKRNYEKIEILDEDKYYE